MATQIDRLIGLIARAHPDVEVAENFVGEDDPTLHSVTFLGDGFDVHAFAGSDGRIYSFRQDEENSGTWISDSPEEGLRHFGLMIGRVRT